MKKQEKQLELIFTEKRFTLQKEVEAKLDLLALRIEMLTHSDITWLSRVEDFFYKYEYLTDKQVGVIDSIIKRHQ